MCRPVTCKVCKKTTWAGCGQHINQVKQQVPASHWCDGRHTEEEKSQVKRGFLARLLGR